MNKNNLETLTVDFYGRENMFHNVPIMFQRKQQRYLNMLRGLFRTWLKLHIAQMLCFDFFSCYFVKDTLNSNTVLVRII